MSARFNKTLGVMQYRHWVEKLLVRLFRASDTGACSILRCRLQSFSAFFSRSLREIIQPPHSGKTNQTAPIRHGSRPISSNPPRQVAARHGSSRLPDENAVLIGRAEIDVDA